MIDTQSLRGKILDRALHGELTCQVPEDGTGAQLYQEIIEKRKELSKAGRIKNLKKLPEVSEDEGLFEIPQSWKWIRLGNVASIFGGKRIPAGRKLTTEDTGHKYIRVSEMKNETVIIEDMLYVPEDIYPSISQYIINKEDVYITVAGTIGRVGKIPEEIDGANLTENADRIVFDMIDQDWLISCLSSSEIQKEISLSTTQVAQPKLAIKRIEDLIIPLPPLNEQKRMVHILNQVFPILDTINALQDQYASNQEALKSKIIMAGIQGRLTDQKSEDGSSHELYQKLKEEKERLVQQKIISKEKPIQEVSNKEAPYPIPDNWKWVRFSDLYSLSNGVASRGSEGGKPHPVLRLADLTSGEIDIENVRSIDLTDSEFNSHKIHKGDLVFIRVNGSRDKVANAFLYSGEEEISYCDHLFCGHKISDLFEPEYVMLVYYSSMVKKQIDPEIKTTAGQNTINQKSMSKIMIPLPPTAEQRRIVDKVNMLLLSIPE